MADPVAAARFTALYEARMADLTAQLSRGEISLQTWQVTMRELVRESFAAQIWAATDGDPKPEDYLKIGNQIQQQDRYLAKFAREIKAGTVQPGTLESRAKLYARSGKQAYWDQATGAVRLPEYPGQQQCLGNCGCEWIDNGDGTWTWQRGENCSLPSIRHLQATALPRPRR